MFWFKHANTRKHISEKSWLSGWIILNTLAHLAHLAQFYFSLIFSAINTYNCFWFDLTNKKNFSDWRQKHGEKWPMLTTFFHTATAAITGKIKSMLFVALLTDEFPGDSHEFFWVFQQLARPLHRLFSLPGWKEEMGKSGGRERVRWHWAKVGERERSR